MKPWESIARAVVPESGAQMALLRRDDEWVIRVDGHTLMSTRTHGSEDALANLSFDRASTEDGAVLVGGLGMGFTAAAALGRSSPHGRVVVAELVSAVVEWNRTHFGHVAGRPLQDPRMEVEHGDVVEVLRDGQRRWNVILLDVDNGPEGLSRSGNQWLYGGAGLRTIFEVLEPGGVLGVWSASPDQAFTGRMGRAGFAVEVHRVRARGTSGGARHIIWTGLRV